MSCQAAIPALACLASVPFHPAPALPPRFASQLPLRRGLYELERGGQAGLELHFIDAGPSDAPAIVFLHGSPSWSFQWRRVIAELPTYRCIAPDLLGFGLSGRLATADAHTLERHAASIRELIDALKLSNVMLVGHDWGGPIAAAVGARWDGRIRALALSHTSVVQAAETTARRSWFDRLARTPGLGELAVHRLGVPATLLWAVERSKTPLDGPVTAAYRWPLRSAEDRVGPLALARWSPTDRRQPGYPSWQDAEAWIRGYTGPTALVWGRHDPLMSQRLPPLKAALPGAHVTLCNAGPWIQEDAPEAFATAIRDADREGA